ncbi:membrane protein insertase YidC [Clostridium paridis]|nr:membrane protein insertase YidC [Clostridium paridis]
MFQVIVDFMYNIVEKLHDLIVNIGITDVGASYVLAVILFTLLVRLFLLPLNIKSTRSTAKMQEIQPEVKKLQAKHKNSPEKLNQEMMKLYKENNVSMTGGCLPMIIQMPILFALYWAFRQIHQVSGAGFLWIPNLALRDPYFILPVLAAGSTYLSTVFTTKVNAASVENSPMNMSTMNIGMSVMIGVSAINFESLLVIYWIVGSLIQMLQTYVIVVLPKKNKAKAA